MECQKCKQRPANVHITQYINGQKHETHLCEECAQTANINVQLPQLPLNNLKDLLGFLGQSHLADKKSPELICSNCQTPYRKVYETGYVGCSQCYSHFAGQIKPVLQRIHGATSHRGKIPARQGAEYMVRREIEELKAKLQQAIVREEYEQAAEMRDRIKLLEEKQAGKRGEHND